MLPFHAASALFATAKWNIEALTANIVHLYLDQSHDWGAPGQNNTMVGRQKLSLLYSVP
jgi:hypothetical protein